MILSVEEQYDLKMILEEHIDELDGLIEDADDADKKELTDYQSRVVKLLEKVNQ